MPVRGGYFTETGEFVNGRFAFRFFWRKKIAERLLKRVGLGL
jgi:hypothetical protein